VFCPEQYSNEYNQIMRMLAWILTALDGPPMAVDGVGGAFCFSLTHSGFMVALVVFGYQKTKRQN
jgi:hypothetical protein